MSVLKQAKAVGIAVVLAVLAGCAGQVNESAQGPSKIESDAERAAREARQAEFLASQEAANAKQEAANAAIKTAEDLRKGAMAADTLFFFEFDRSDLRQDALDDLDSHVKYLASDRSAKVRLEGHGDERGTRAYNLALGERRSNSVARYLVIQGVNRSQIESMSYGEERPLSLSRDDNGWSRNRRVELIYQ
ncbi:MAG TPA: peptidoglycan-associated lipoprotein [Gammaproteobacteria bacterium]|nr:peptidoglycan-associated lipoprotein [Gammaproteobacteria bacterium]